MAVDDRRLEAERRQREDNIPGYRFPFAVWPKGNLLADLGQHPYLFFCGKRASRLLLPSSQESAMRKLSLSVDALVVQSFTPDPFDPETGMDSHATAPMLETPGCSSMPPC
jgi:hypothetical protein